jgi:hypothetical protein
VHLALSATVVDAVAILGLAAEVGWLTVTGRRRDDRKRADDRERDSRARAEERERDDRRRADDRQRDDRLREETRQEAQRREQAERTAREDCEARQVVVFTEEKAHNQFTHLITVSAPHEYPIKQVEGCIARLTHAGMSLTGFGHPGNTPEVDDRRIYYTFNASLQPGDTPAIRFIDWHGNRYYQYKHYTARSPQHTDWPEAIRKLDEWIDAGPGRR